MSTMSMVMSYKYSNRREISFDHLRLRFYVVFMGKSGLKYRYVSRAVCAYAHIFQKRPGCALIGACALIRTITVHLLNKFIDALMNLCSEVPRQISGNPAGT